MAQLGLTWSAGLGDVANDFGVEGLVVPAAVFGSARVGVGARCDGTVLDTITRGGTAGSDGTGPVQGKQKIGSVDASWAQLGSSSSWHGQGGRGRSKAAGAVMTSRCRGRGTRSVRFDVEKVAVLL